MNSTDKLGMIVAVAVVVIFVSIAAGGSSLEKTISKDLYLLRNPLLKKNNLLKI